MTTTPEQIDLWRDALIPKLLSGELKSFSRTEMAEAV